MKSKSVSPALLALILSVSVDAQRQNGSSILAADLVRFDQQWQEAVVTGDAEFIERRTADSFSFTHGGGTTIETKADWVNQAKQVPRPYLQRKASDQAVEVHGDIALVFGRLDVRVPAHADSNSLCYAVQYVHLYVKQSGQWMFLSHRTTQLLEPRHPCAAP